MNSDTVKPMPPRTATPTMWREPEVVRETTDAEAQREHRRAGDADELADDEARHDADGHPAGQRVVDRVAAEHHAGVGEREDGHDHEARDRVQGRLEPLEHRTAASRDAPA